MPGLPKSLRKQVIQAGSKSVLAVLLLTLPFVEGMRYKPYMDGGGVWTVCVGHTGKDVIPDKVYSKDECDAFLSSDIQVAQKAVERDIHVPLNNFQAAAMTSFAFNVGIGNFARSSVVRYMNERQYTRACNALNKWVYINKEVSSGLVSRRAIEDEICQIGNAQ